MLAYPKVDQSMDRLNSGGWKMGDLCTDRNGERIWIVTGHRGKHWIVAQAPSQVAAWWLAWRQAEQLGPVRRRKTATGTR